MKDVSLPFFAIPKVPYDHAGVKQSTCQKVRRAAFPLMVCGYSPQPNEQIKSYTQWPRTDTDIYVGATAYAGVFAALAGAHAVQRPAMTAVS